MKESEKFCTTVNLLYHLVFYTDDGVRGKGRTMIRGVTVGLVSEMGDTEVQEFTCTPVT